MPHVRRPGSAPDVMIDVAPAYEMLMSVAAALDDEERETLEVGPEWVASVRERAGDDLLARITALTFSDGDAFRHLIGLAYDTQAPRDVPTFLEHLRETDAAEVKLHLVQFYDRDTRRCTPPATIRAAVGGDREAIEQFLTSCHPDWEPWTRYLKGVLEADADWLKEELVAVLEAWAERVWAPEAPTIMPILERDATAKRELARELPLDRFVTTATNGVEYVPRPGIDRLVMIPSYLQRPVVTYSEFGRVLLVVYPVADESVTALVDAPPLRLVRMAKALGDEKRLRILRALAEGEKTLVELAEQFGVAKTTMHHHMIILRSAGLITAAVGTKRYRLRREAIPDAGALLTGYLGAEFPSGTTTPQTEGPATTGQED